MYCSKERGICPLARIIYQPQILQSLYHLSISSFFPQPVATLFMKYLQINFFVKIQLCVGEKLLLSPGG